MTGRRLRLLAHMAAPEFHELMAQSAVLDVPPRHQMFAEGNTPGYLHVVLEGLVELSGKCGEKEAAIDLVQAGDPFILAAVVNKAPYLMTARTIAPSRILFIPATNFRTSLRRDPGLAAGTSSELSRAFRSMVRQLRTHKLRSAKMRLASYLAVEYRKLDQPARLTLTISKRVLASLLGLEPESLSRLFANLALHGVEVIGDEIVIRDIDELETLASYDGVLDNPN